MIIDVFAHVLPPKFLARMQTFDANILDSFPYMKNNLLTDVDAHLASMTSGHQQIISAVNLNPEDFLEPQLAAELCQAANAEIATLVRDHPTSFPAGVGMLPLNNIPAALHMIDEQIVASPQLVGVQLFTRALGKPITDPTYAPLFEKLARNNVPIWVHPVFDSRKNDNNITFSWEYELTQTMNAIVNAHYFQQYPDLKIIVHHAGAMVPFFSQRIKYTQSAENYRDFKKFYVDTAILGNLRALELALNFFGSDHVLFGTDSPFGIPPTGPTQVIEQAVNEMAISAAEKQQIFSGNWQRLLR